MAPCEELVANAFLYPFDWLDKGYFDFRHQLLRDALYGTLPASDLRRLEARAGEFGAELIGASEIHASVHFERAGLRGQAYRAAVAGAEEANRVSSRHEAFELYARAIDNVPDGLSTVELAELYNAYAGAAFAVDNIPAIDHAVREARRYFLEAGRPLDAAVSLVDLAGMARRDVRPVEERHGLLAQAEDELRALPDTPERASALSDVRVMQAIMEIDAGRVEAAAALFKESREFRLQSTDPETGRHRLPRSRGRHPCGARR